MPEAMTVRDLVLELGTLTDEQWKLPVTVGDCCPCPLDSVEVQGSTVVLGGAG